MTAPEFAQGETGRGRVRFIVRGPEGAVELRGDIHAGVAVYLVHRPDAGTGRFASGPHDPECDLLPGLECWPDLCTVHGGPLLDAFLGGDTAAVEAYLRERWEHTFGAAAAAR